MILKIILTLVLISSMFSLNSVHAQYMFGSLPPNMPDIMLQLVLRDSEGRLVSYIQADQIVAIDPTILDDYLDNKQNKKIIMREGKSYEHIYWQGRTETIDKAHAMTTFVLYSYVGDTYQTALEMIHNSYQVNPGDTVTVYWDVVRPI